MLNNYKKIKLEKISDTPYFFWKSPFPTQVRFQMSPTPQKDLVQGLPVVFGSRQLPVKRWWLTQKKKKIKPLLKLHFFYSAIVFNSIFLFKKFPKNKNSSFGKFKVKKKFLLIRKIFNAKKCYKGFVLKANKGGFVTTTLGFRSFTPKSHSARLLTHRAPIEWVIGLKVAQRRKRFSGCKKTIRISVISSSKPQKKSIRLKKGERMRGQGPYWRKLAAIINKRIAQEEQE